MNKYAQIYLQEFKKVADLNTNIPGEDTSHLMQRLYTGNVNVNKMLENATKQNLSIGKIPSEAINGTRIAPRFGIKFPIIDGIKNDPQHALQDLKNKVKPNDIKTFIDKNPHVFDSVINTPLSTPVT